jgi:hypothetical protein
MRANLGRDTAETDEPQRLAGELDAFDAQPSAAAHRAVHCRQASGRRPHQRDGAFGHCGVAIPPDDMKRDAVPGELFRVHIAARPGAEENDVPEPSALGGDRRRQRGVINYRDLGVAEQGRAGSSSGVTSRLRLMVTGGFPSRRSFSVIAARVSSASTKTARRSLPFRAIGAARDRTTVAPSPAERRAPRG